LLDKKYFKLNNTIKPSFMKKISFLFAATLFLFFTPACKKDKDKTQSKMELLTTGSWKVTASVSDNDGNGSYETNEFASFSSCFIDNIFTFKTNGQLELDEGPTKCDIMDPQTETVVWQLTNNEANLVVDSDTYDITELSTTTFKIKENLSAGRSSVVTFTKR
jgi:hypothetical protein